jgi:hypothetical protein
MATISWLLKKRPLAVFAFHYVIGSQPRYPKKIFVYHQILRLTSLCKLIIARCAAILFYNKGRMSRIKKSWKPLQLCVLRVCFDWKSSLLKVLIRVKDQSGLFLECVFLRPLFCCCFYISKNKTRRKVRKLYNKALVANIIFRNKKHSWE